jgi:hypothetical protein
MWGRGCVGGGARRGSERGLGAKGVVGAVVGWGGVGWGGAREEGKRTMLGKEGGRRAKRGGGRGAPAAEAEKDSRPAVPRPAPPRPAAARRRAAGPEP